MWIGRKRSLSLSAWPTRVKLLCFAIATLSFCNIARSALVAVVEQGYLFDPQTLCASPGPMFYADSNLRSTQVSDNVAEVVSLAVGDVIVEKFSAPNTGLLCGVSIFFSETSPAPDHKLLMSLYDASIWTIKDIFDGVAVAKGSWLGDINANRAEFSFCKDSVAPRVIADDSYLMAYTLEQGPALDLIFVKTDVSTTVHSADLDLIDLGLSYVVVFNDESIPAVYCKGSDVNLLKRDNSGLKVRANSNSIKNCGTSSDNGKTTEKGSRTAEPSSTSAKEKSTKTSSRTVAPTSINTPKILTTPTRRTTRKRTISKISSTASKTTTKTLTTVSTPKSGTSSSNTSSKTILDSTLKTASKTTAKVTSENTSKTTSKSNTKATSETTTKTTSENTSKNPTKTSAKATSETTSENTSKNPIKTSAKATSETTSENTSKNPIKTSTKATSETITKTTSKTFAKATSETATKTTVKSVSSSKKLFSEISSKTPSTILSRKTLTTVSTIKSSSRTSFKPTATPAVCISNGIYVSGSETPVSPGFPLSIIGDSFLETFIAPATGPMCQLSFGVNDASSNTNVELAFYDNSSAQIKIIAGVANNLFTVTSSPSSSVLAFDLCENNAPILSPGQKYTFVVSYKSGSSLSLLLGAAGISGLYYGPSFASFPDAVVQGVVPSGAGVSFNLTIAAQNAPVCQATTATFVTRTTVQKTSLTSTSSKKSESTRVTSSASVPTVLPVVCVANGVYISGSGPAVLSGTALSLAGDSFLESFISPSSGTLCQLAVGVIDGSPSTVAVLTLYDNTISQVSIVQGQAIPIYITSASSSSSALLFTICGPDAPRLMTGQKYTFVVTYTKGPAVSLLLAAAGISGLYFGPSFASSPDSIVQGVVPAGAGVSFNLTFAVATAPACTATSSRVSTPSKSKTAVSGTTLSSKKSSLIPTATAVPSPSPRPTGLAQLDPCQKSIVLQATNIYENSELALPWCYCENIRDGRGYTAGIAGFCTGTQDAYQIIAAYSNLPGNGGEFNSMLPKLKSLYESSKQPNGDVSGLNGYCSAWSTACQNPVFRQAQLEGLTNLYFTPSQELADQLGLKTALSRGQMYDAGIQHGFDNTPAPNTDPDSLNALVSRTNKRMGGSPASNPSVSETAWLAAFFAIRLDDLCNPADKSSQSVWCESISRVKSYQYALSQGEVDFSNALTLLDNDGKVMTINCDLSLVSF